MVISDGQTSLDFQVWVSASSPEFLLFRQLEILLFFFFFFFIYFCFI